ncbi:unnamed protein product [Colias eurytheme]|nr:unnamed protein product [Colias eurytheme]
MHRISMTLNHSPSDTPHSERFSKRLTFLANNTAGNPPPYSKHVRAAIVLGDKNDVICCHYGGENVTLRINLKQKLTALGN